LKVCIDASVASKWFNRERFTDEAVRIKEGHERAEMELIAPAHLIYEVGNSIWRNPQIGDDDARDAIMSLIRLDIGLLPPDAQRAGRAMEIARGSGMSYYDALYIQAAEEFKAVLVTADRGQLRAARKMVRAIHIRDTGSP
jgi:predicted nucleic acid-binding protein